MDFDWIKKTEFDFNLKVFYWEPMADYIEYIEFCEFLSNIENNETFYWQQGPVVDYKRWNPFEDERSYECVFIHHILTTDKGKALWGGIDQQEYYELEEDEGLSDDEMIHRYEPYKVDAAAFGNVDREWIDARKFMKLKF